MAAPRKTWFVILGLLNWRPMSGYDIKKLIEVALSYFWSESYGQLYPTLDRLVGEGLASRRTEKRGGRSRYVYSITARGKRQFLAWMKEPADIPRARNELQVRFFLSARLPTRESIRLLEEYREQQRRQYELYRDSEKVLALAVRRGGLPDELEEVLRDERGSGRSRGTERTNEPMVFYLTLRHGILAIEARLAWCDEAIAALRRRGGRRA